MDSLVKVSDVRFDGALLEISGSRMILLYDAKTRGLSLSNSQQSLRIEIALPAGDISERGVLAALQKVFLTAGESAQRQCSEDQRLDFQDWIKRSGTTNKKSKPDFQPGNGVFEVILLSYWHPRLFGGGRWNQASTRNFNTWNSHYTEMTRRNRIEGTVMVAIAIDEQGVPLDALLLNSLDRELNFEAVRAMRSWRFSPATLDGKPGPVAIKVEFGFWLH